ncbi:hypothetical protein [Clostridium tertium]|uniref:Uncharacterized protein n=1 Tax=Clostridium tertium TaxID=1559 RepID=A0A6N3ESR3_9CLOT
MLLVNCRWQQEEIIQGMEGIEVNEIKIYKHVKTDGMRMFFDYNITAEERKSMIEDENSLIMRALIKIPRINTLAISILPFINGSVVEGYQYTVCGHKE